MIARWLALATVVAAAILVASEFRHDIEPTSFGYIDRDRWTSKVIACSVNDPREREKRRQYSIDSAAKPNLSQKPIDQATIKELEDSLFSGKPLPPSPPIGPEETARRQKASDAAAADFDAREPLFVCVALAH